MTNQQIAPRNLSIADACRYTGLGRSSIYQAMKYDPAFPQGLKIGKRRLLPVADLDTWLDQKQVGMAH